MNQKKVLLLCTFKYRDLAGLVLIKVFLEKLGHKAVIIPNVPFSNLLSYHIHKIKPHLIVFSQLSAINEVKKLKLKEYNIGTAFLLSEGELFFKEFNEGIAGKFLDVHDCDLYFAWNKKIKSYIKKHHTIDLEKCYLGGVPRFDFYHPRFSKVLTSKEEFCALHNMDPSRQIITWATNFGYVNFKGDETTHKIFMERLQKDGFGVPPPFKDFTKLVEEEVNSRELLTNNVVKIAKDFPNSYVIIKVHPGEHISWYQEQVKKSPELNNIRIIQFDHIWNVLNISNVHLSRSCTTCIEAWFLNKPTIELQLNPNEWFIFKPCVKGSEIVYSYEQCVKAIREYLNGKKISSEKQEERKKLFEKLYYKVDGKRAEFHANIINEWLTNKSKELNLPAWSIKKILSTVRQEIKSFLGVDEHKLLRSLIFKKAHTDERKGFKKEDIDSLIQKIDKILKAEQSLNKKMISHN